MAKNKKTDLQIKINIPNDEYMKHIANAYGLVCQYRTLNKVPHEKLESWLLRLVMEGCNALFSYHNQQLEKLKKEQEAKKTTEEKSETIIKEK